ncbi:MAG: carbohydrate ABC transporter permease [Clostridia bacterium]|nr:carbohydrate ABC transporter permease [Clostridia bacterium]
MKKTHIKNKHMGNVFSIAVLSILIIYTVSMVCLFGWSFFTSVKTQNEFRTNVLGLPQQWQFSNYPYIFGHWVKKVVTTDGIPLDIGMFEQLLYTIVTVFGGAAVCVIAHAVMGYVCVNYKCKLSSLIYWIVIITMMLPIVGTQASEMKVVRAFGIYDNVLGNLVFKFNFLGAYFLVFYAAFGGVSKEYFEAARIDGADDFAIFFRIMIPLVKNMILTIFLIKFIEFWNDYQTPLLYLPSHPTLAVGLYSITTTPTKGLTTTPMRMTACIVMLIPVLILYICFRDMIMGNVTMGGVKE